MVKNLPANAGDLCSIPGLEQSPREGNGNPLQYSCPENSTDRGVCGLQPTGLQRVRDKFLTSTYIFMKVKVESLSRVRLFATPWTVAHQAPQSMGFSRQEYWSGLPFPSPGDLPHRGIEPGSPALQADALTSEPAGRPHKYAHI